MLAGAIASKTKEDPAYKGLGMMSLHYRALRLLPCLSFRACLQTRVRLTCSSRDYLLFAQRPT